MKKIGMIGVGNMGSAIINSLVNDGSWELFVSAKNQEKLQKFANERGITGLSSNRQLVDASDVVILAIKPNMLATVIEEILPSLEKKRPLLISVAAGISLAQLDKMTGHIQLPIARIMPNIAAAISESTSSMAVNSLVTDEQANLIKEIFTVCGKVYEIPEADFSAFIALAGSSPAMLFMFIDAMSRNGVKHGIPKQMATEIASQAILGAVKLLMEKGENPWAMIDQVSSPRGTTVEGVLTLQEEGFLSAINKAMDAIINKDKELGKDA